ncbi:hypothetical protein M3Y94_00386700 [Aphelenchoides besseyi]|nr:hypothetical protein M3Y94_00386700 [Aphelenchoides besseyi]KAI6235037.1 SCAVenger receptor (CD36 family) related [Aphelenchoides besseyi]
MHCDKYRIGMAAMAVFVFLLGAIGTFLYFDIPLIIRRKINEQTFLGFDASGNYTNTTQKWLSPQFKFQLDIWTYSVQNPTNVVKVYGTKPILVQKGPYTFDEFQSKQAAFTENNTRVFYRNKRVYYFNRAKSCPTCSLDDVVTVPNIVLQSILDKIQNSKVLQIAFDTLLQSAGETMFLKVAVGELLFDGYVDPFLGKWCSNEFLRTICKALAIPEKIGLFYKRNNTYDPKYEINTGLQSVDLIGKVYSYDDKKMTKSWYGPYARMINGTDGQLFAPGLDRRDSNILQLFIGQICRTIELEYNGKMDFQGVPVYLYHPAKSMNDVERQRELGFCNPQTPTYFQNTYIQHNGCLPAGLMDMSSCLPGNPRAYISQPHFYGSNSALRDALRGMPEPTKSDDTIIGIEPASGVVTFAQQHTQLNLGLINGTLSSFANMTSRIIPIIWLNDSAVFDTDTRAQLLQLSNYRSYSFGFSLAFYVFAFICTLSIVGIYIVRRRQESDIEHTLLEDADELPTEENPNLISSEA